MTATIADFPVPRGASSVAEWRIDGGTARSFRGTERVTETEYGEDVRVDIVGTQYIDGSVERYIVMSDDSLLCPSEARHLAANLLAAAAEVDRLTGRPTNAAQFPG